ncbi:vanin-like protein 1 [Anticarsia gemmatalis]|uniref:vanin-like protein 1 n=1 Tax=Anticarsia gemmatalis TaxID=129554 RepID=UPI003F761777
MKIFGLVVCFLCVNFLEASETYKAGVLHLDKDATNYAPFIYEAGKSDVDILVLPSPEPSDIIDNYDEIVESISKAAKESSLYVVAHLYEKARCQNKVEVVESNLVFDREGTVVSVYRKPVSNLANCTSSPSELVTFTTDFGVTFGLLMDEDIVLRNVEYMKGLKNFVMTGAGDGSFLSASQFSTSWAFVNNVNLISSNGIYISKSGLQTGSGSLVVADLNKNGGSEFSSAPVTRPSNFPSEDLSQYMVKPLDMEASTLGYKDTVCHRSFCCEFNIKTSAGSKSDVPYGLAAFDGVRPYSTRHNIGAQTCAVFACAGLYKRSCGLGSNNSTNIIFERISVAANFTKQNAQYPIIQSTSVLPTENFKFDAKPHGISTQVTLEIVDGQNLLKFGVFGRDFSKDFESFAVESSNSDSTYNIYDLIFNEDVQEFFDYVWIRLRILLVVVSIYVLEMM